MSESFKAAHDYPDISERFDSDGYYLPVDVLSADEVAHYRQVLVRGRDRYGHFQHVPPPSGDMTREAMAWHSRILSAQNQAMYADANTG